MTDSKYQATTWWCITVSKYLKHLKISLQYMGISILLMDSTLSTQNDNFYKKPVKPVILRTPIA